MCDCGVVSRVVRVAEQAVGCAPEDPAFCAENRWIIGWQASIEGAGHYGDHSEQPDDSVKFVFAIPVIGEPGFHSPVNAGIPFDRQ